MDLRRCAVSSVFPQSRVIIAAEQNWKSSISSSSTASSVRLGSCATSPGNNFILVLFLTTNHDQGGLTCLFFPHVFPHFPPVFNQRMTTGTDSSQRHWSHFMFQEDSKCRSFGDAFVAAAGLFLLHSVSGAALVPPMWRHCRLRRRPSRSPGKKGTFILQGGWTVVYVVHDGRMADHHDSSRGRGVGDQRRREAQRPPRGTPAPIRITPSIFLQVVHAHSHEANHLVPRRCCSFPPNISRLSSNALLRLIPSLSP
ncbi:hypothetical protein BDP55DRAFT_281487 [Colletotrichum godetiae]|uniref:Uncharacterized protein n=1 Tax=Colletotrichum godetiae TaxID=1209918 RepID=A0AAJ0ADM4_9PEZI|nr:uncharacterized protein BDP55DRAFT_281487 [Colletotrichum godetiae]KAK1671952.1 hypothetical protein BDP55DRAFT_281487 [Colletotrichum godetiae]